jgi:hypothetical protein
MSFVATLMLFIDNSLFEQWMCARLSKSVAQRLLRVAILKKYSKENYLKA